MKLNDIREQRALRVTEMRGLLDRADAEKRALTADEQTKFDKLKGEIAGMEADEARAQFLEDAERRSMDRPDAEQRDHATLEGSVSILRILQAATEGRSLTGAEAEYAKETERRTGRKAEGIYVPLAAFEKRGTVNSTTSGADLVATDHRPDQYIGPLRNALLARKLGVRVLSGLRGNVAIPKMTTGHSVGWVAEGGALTGSDSTYETVSLAPKHAGGLTEMSRQLIMQSSPDIEQLVRDDLAALLAQAIDSALIKGGGTSEPVGVIATSGIQTSSLATLTWGNILTMLQKADLENASAANFVGSTKVKAKLAGTLKASGIAGYLMENGRMADLPCYFSNQVAEKTGTPNTGRLIAGDWSQVLLGIWSEVDLLVNPFDSTAYARGGVMVRAMTTCDVAVRYPKAFVLADDIAI